MNFREYLKSENQNSFGMINAKSLDSKVISFLSSKGGVGKTTCSYLLANQLSNSGYKTLLIDGDPQANLSYSILANKTQSQIPNPVTLYDLIIGSKSLREALITISDNFNFICSTPRNSKLDYSLEGLPDRKLRKISHLFEKIKSEFDVVICDLAPSLNFANAGILSVTNNVIIPVNYDVFSAFGLEQTLAAINSLENRLGFTCEKMALLNKAGELDADTRHSGTEIIERHQDLFLDTAISYDLNIKSLAENFESIGNNNASLQDEVEEFANDIISQVMPPGSPNGQV